MMYKIEYEIPMLRAIWTANIWANDEESARQIFQTNNPKARIRKIVSVN